MSENKPVATVIPGRRRELTTKKANRRLRLEGWIPANLVHKGESTLLEIEAKLLSRAWLNGKTFTLDLQGETQQVMIHELQLLSAKRQPLHVDLRPA